MDIGMNVRRVFGYATLLPENLPRSRRVRIGEVTEAVGDLRIAEACVHVVVDVGRKGSDLDTLGYLVEVHYVEAELDVGSLLLDHSTINTFELIHLSVYVADATASVTSFREHGLDTLESTVKMFQVVGRFHASKLGRIRVPGELRQNPQKVLTGPWVGLHLGLGRFLPFVPTDVTVLATDADAPVGKVLLMLGRVRRVHR
jgi:hypothetical protein